jgi:hypothetical protein
VRRTIQLLVRVVLRSRLGLALALALVVLVVVGAAKGFSNSADTGPGLTGAPDRPIITATPTAADDGLASPEPVPSLASSAGTAPPVAVAKAFALAWVNHANIAADRWYAGVLPHCTKALAGKLVGVDPASVPAARLIGEPTLVPYAESIAEAAIKVDSGLLRLRLTAVQGRWLVDGVDWERG